MGKLVIISDDLTGTADAGAYSVQYGKKIRILADDACENFVSDDEDVLEINMSSRVIAGADARKQHAAIGKMVRSLSDTVIMKKMDTGFRGNASFEIEGLLQSLPQDICFVVDTIPELNTFTLYGNQYPEGQILPKSLYAKDPLKTQTSAYIPDILAADTDIPVGLIDIDSVKGNHLVADVQKMLERGKRILVFDAVTGADTSKIVSLLDKKFHPLWAGSLGIAEALSAWLFGGTFSGKTEAVGQGGVKRKCVCFSASAYHTTRKQIEAAARMKQLIPVALDMHHFCLDPDAELRRVCGLCKNEFRNENFIVYPKIRESDDYPGFDKVILSAISQCSGDVCQSVPFDRLVVIGGETSQAVFRILGIHMLQLTGKPETGIGSGIILDSQFRGKEFSLKGGSVGSVQALEKMITLPSTDID